MSVSPVKDWVEHDGALLRLRLNRPKANLVDAAMIAAQLAGRCSSTLAPKLKCGPSASSSTPRNWGCVR